MHEGLFCTLWRQGYHRMFGVFVPVSITSNSLVAIFYGNTWIFALYFKCSGFPLRNPSIVFQRIPGGKIYIRKCFACNFSNMRIFLYNFHGH